MQKLEHLPLRVDELINPLIKTFEARLAGMEELTLLISDDLLKQRIDPTIASKLLPFQWESIRHSIQQKDTQHAAQSMPR